jgi:hypothetical protein
MLSVLRNGWAQVLMALLGLWLMAAPAVFQYGAPASSVHRIVGPVTASFAIVAISPHMRPLRWMGVPLGGILVVSPFFLNAPAAATANGVAVGLAIVALAFAHGRVTESFGGGWSSLWTGDVAGEGPGEDAV